jgi:hypothetical protein
LIAFQPAVKIAFGLALLVSGLYLVTANGHLLGQDQEYYYRIARSIAHQHTFAVKPLVFGKTELAGARGRDGRFYAQYAPGLPTVLAPLILLGDRMGELMSGLAANYPWIHEEKEDIAARVLVSYFNIPVTAVTAGLLVLLVIRLGYSSFAALFAGAGFALSTFAWGQSRIVFAEPLQALLLLSACLLLFRASRATSLMGGCALALAVLVKITSILALPAFLLLPDERGVPVWRRYWMATAVVVPVIIALATYGWYNYSRFGSFTDIGYSSWGREPEFSGNALGNPLTGLFGLLFSSGRGLIWYAPLMIVALASARRFYVERQLVGRAFVVLVTAWLAVHSSYKGWHGGWGWGPRYLLPILPFLLVPLPVAWHSFAGKLGCFALFLVGTIVQLPGALVDFIVSGQQGMRVFEQSGHERTQEAFNAWRNFNVSGSEIVRHSDLLLRGQLDLAWLTFGNTWLPFVTFSLATFLVLCGLALMIPPLLSKAKATASPPPC